MGVYRNRIEYDVPYYRGKQYNAFMKGRLIWGVDEELPPIDCGDFWLEMSGINIKNGVVRVGGRFILPNNSMKIQWTPTEVWNGYNLENTDGYIYVETFEYTDDNPRTITMESTGISTFVCAWEHNTHPEPASTVDDTNGFTQMTIKGRIENLILFGNRLESLDISELEFCSPDRIVGINVQVNNLNDGAINNIIEQLPQLTNGYSGTINVGYNPEVSSDNGGYANTNWGMSGHVYEVKGWNVQYIT